MKFDVSDEPRGARGDTPRVGDVYRVEGGRGKGRNIQVLVAISQAGYAYLLMLDVQGEIVGTNYYLASHLENRERVGFCPEVADLTMKIQWNMGGNP
jgi:hypothetical protein